MTRIADTIVVTRTSDGSTVVTIDGEELPYETGPDPISVDVEVGRPSAVRLTLLARKVRVNDDMLADIPDHLLEHTHDAEPAPAAPAAAEPVAAEPAPPSFGHVTCAKTGTTWARCAEDCTLKALNNGTAVCDGEDDCKPKGVKPS